MIDLERMMLSRFSLSGVLIALTLAGCVTKSPAPVSERARPGSPAQSEAPAEPPRVARPGYWVVKPGDTLIRIALENGQNYRDIAAWSGLENPNLIEVGQELRVRPPDSRAVAKPVNTRRRSAPGAGRRCAPAPADEGCAASRRAASCRIPSKPGPRPRSPKLRLWRRRSSQSRRQSPSPNPDPKVETKVETKAEPAKPETSKAANGDSKIEWGWPASGKIIASFNETSSKGVDLAGKSGDPVLAAAGGRVVYAGTGLRGYGKLVIVKHDNSFLSAYAHNQSLLR